MNKPSVATSVIAGAIGGLAGAWMMNQFQALMQVASKPEKTEQGDDATVKTADAISTQVFHHELAKDEKKWAGPAVHYAFGTLTGAIYGALAETVPATRIGYGTAYGTAVWLGADEIGVPAFGLSKPPEKTPMSQHVQALTAHLVYGLTTDLCRRAALKLQAKMS